MNCERCFQSDLPEPKSFAQKLEFRISSRPGFKREAVAQSMAGPDRKVSRAAQSFQLEPATESLPV